MQKLLQFTSRHLMLPIVFILLCIICIPFHAIAEQANNTSSAPLETAEEPLKLKEEASTTPLPSSKEDNSFMLLLKVIFALILIIGLIYVLLKFLAKKNQKFFSNRGIRSLAGVSLGQHKSIQLIEIGNHIYIVGVGDNVQLLEKVSLEEDVAQIRQTMQPSSPAISQNLVQIVLEKWKASRRSHSVEEQELTDDSNFEQIFSNKLKQFSPRKKMIDEWLEQENTKDRSKES